MNLANTHGVIIKDIEPNSPAISAGLRRGDVIIAINKRPICTINDYNQAFSQVRGICLIRTIRGFFVMEE